MYKNSKESFVEKMDKKGLSNLHHRFIGTLSGVRQQILGYLKFNIGLEL